MSFLKHLSKIFNADQKIVGREPRLTRKVAKKPRKKASRKFFQQSQAVINQAQSKAREIIIEAKDKAYRLRQEVDEKIRQKYTLLDRQREEIQKRLAEIERQAGALEEKEKLLTKNELRLEEKFSEIEEIKQKQLKKLERVALLTKEEAKDLILKLTEKKLESEIGRRIREAEEEIKEKVELKTKEILVDSIYHGATDYVAEYSVSIIKLTDEDIKGRIIGKEGRNIRTFERATGVDVDLDEDKIIRLSSFDSVRREVARVALEKLLRDGRIQPARIEEVVLKTKKEVDKLMFKAGENLCHRLQVYNLPAPIIEKLGRFKYRYSYGQNMITHTLEETKIGIALAGELKANVRVVRLACLLHDIGKVITEEEGTHVQVGVDFLKKHNIPQEVIDCVAQHHEDEDFSSVESVIVYIADAISGSRPGARYEDYGEYTKRLKDLEDLAKTFEGVKEAFAIQAGREVRVIVDPARHNDASTFKLASDIRDKIKQTMTYPGQVKVITIREVRKSEVAN